MATSHVPSPHSYTPPKQQGSHQRARHLPALCSSSARASTAGAAYSSAAPTTPSPPQCSQQRQMEAMLEAEMEQMEVLEQQSPPTSSAATFEPTPIALPSPLETPSNAFPPEMERETNQWRQYAAAVLFQGRKGLQPQDVEDVGVDVAEELEEFRGRRKTVTYRFPTDSVPHPLKTRYRPSVDAGARKLSMGQQRHSADEGPATDEAFAAAMMLSAAERRLSFPERSLLSANYAILRKSVDRFEVVGAFHRCHSEAYRHFLQSLTCYDLAPPHGLIVMLDAELTIQKAVQILCVHPAPRLAMVNNGDTRNWSMFTVTDCLLALQLARREGDNTQLGSQTLRYFVEQLHGGWHRLVSVDDQTSVWDLARVFSLNRVHRVPVFSADSGELIAVLCPRSICVELLKLISSRCSLSPDLNAISLASRQIGTWHNGHNSLVSITEGESCARAVDLFLDHQMSALPVLSTAAASGRTLLGVVDKNNLLDKLFEQLGAHPESRGGGPERCMRLMEETPVEALLPLSRRRSVRADSSVAEAMRVLAEDGLSESVFVLDREGRHLSGVLSHTDILAFILNYENCSG